MKRKKRQGYNNYNVKYARAVFVDSASVVHHRCIDLFIEIAYPAASGLNTQAIEIELNDCTTIIYDLCSCPIE